MKKVFLVLMMMSVVFSRDWSLMGSNEKDVNGTDIRPKHRLFIEANKLSADNFDGYSVGWGNGAITFEYMNLSGKKESRFVKNLEYEVSYYKIGFDTSRGNTQPVSLGLLGGLFYGNESVKSFSLLSQKTLGVFVGLGIKGEITDSLALHASANFYSGWNEDFTRRGIYSYGFKYIY